MELGMHHYPRRARCFASRLVALSTGCWGAPWYLIEIWQFGIQIIHIDAAGTTVTVVHFLTSNVLVPFPKPFVITDISIGINTIGRIILVIVNAAGPFMVKEWSTIYIAVFRTEVAFCLLYLIDTGNFRSQINEMSLQRP